MAKRIGFVIEVTDRENGESLDKIFISRAKVLKFDERTYPHIMRANAIELAKQQFCKENECDTRTVGKLVSFAVIETLK